MDWTKTPAFNFERHGYKISKPRTRMGFDVLGWEPGEFQGEGIQKMVDQEDSGKLFDLALKKGYARGEVKNYVKDTGQVIRYEVAITRIAPENDRKFKVVFFPHDMRKDSWDKLRAA